MQQKEQLRAQLRKTLFTYAHGLPVNVALGELRRLGDELTQIALQTTDTGAAISTFAIDVYGKAIAFTSEDNDRLILTTVGGKEAITLPKKEAIALGKIIMEQSQSLNEP